MAGKRNRDAYKTNEESLEILLKEALKDLDSDLQEANENCEVYKDQIVNNPMGKDQYGPSYHQALTIKANVRDKQIKVINIIKDRLKVKELLKTQDASGANNPERALTPLEMIKLAEDLDALDSEEKRIEEEVAKINEEKNKLPNNEQ